MPTRPEYSINSKQYIGKVISVPDETEKNK